MATIGIRQAKARLGSLLRDVQRGATWIITDRGRPVGKIVPLSSADMSIDEWMERLREAGRIYPRRRPRRPLPPPIPMGGDTARRYLQEDRDLRA